MICVFAYKKLNELNSQLGFVPCEEVLASKLLKEGAVDNPYEGALALHTIDPTIPVSDGLPTAPTKTPTKPVKPATTNPSTNDEPEQPKKKKKGKK